jgi:hypothetical protein
LLLFSRPQCEAEILGFSVKVEIDDRLHSPHGFDKKVHIRLGSDLSRRFDNEEKESRQGREATCRRQEEKETGRQVSLPLDANKEVTVSEELNQDEELETRDGDQNLSDEDEYEEITSDEVDRIVEALEGLISSTESVNIQTYLEEALNNIFYLVYDQEDAEGRDDDEVADAA